AGSQFPPAYLLPCRFGQQCRTHGQHHGIAPAEREGLHEKIGRRLAAPPASQTRHEGFQQTAWRQRLAKALHVMDDALPLYGSARPEQFYANGSIARGISATHGRSPGGGIHSGGTERDEGSFRRSISSMSRRNSSSVAENGASPPVARLRAATNMPTPSAK